MVTNYSDVYLRQSGIADPLKFKFPVTILGVGAIGSIVAVALAKMGCLRGLTIIDSDVVESHNIANQMFAKNSLGMRKVDHIKDLCEGMSETQVKTYFGRLIGQFIESKKEKLVQAKDVLKGIIISTPDSMLARKTLWDLCKYNPETPFVVDARMAGQYFQVLIASTMMGFEDYEESLIDDKEASNDVCSIQSIIYTNFIVGGVVASIVKKLQLGEDSFVELRMDVSTMEMTITLPNKKKVSNKEALAIYGSK